LIENYIPGYDVNPFSKNDDSTQNFFIPTWYLIINVLSKVFPNDLLMQTNLLFLSFCERKWNLLDDICQLLFTQTAKLHFWNHESNLQYFTMIKILYFWKRAKWKVIFFYGFYNYQSKTFLKELEKKNMCILCCRLFCSK